MLLRPDLENSLLSMKPGIKAANFSTQLPVNVIDLTIGFVYENLSQLFYEAPTKRAEMPIISMSLRSLLYTRWWALHNVLLCERFSLRCTLITVVLIESVFFSPGCKCTPQYYSIFQYFTV